MPLTKPDPDDLNRRVEITVAVRDTDAIPKVPDAGEVRDQDGQRIQVMHNGVLIEEGCYYGAFMTEIIRRLRGHHEPQEELVFHRIIERLAAEAGEKAMVELGAFWSYYSMWFQRALPGATNIMVEPDPNNLEVGRRNFALNDMQGSFVQAAVGFEHGGRIRLRCESDGRVRTLPTVTLDGLMSDHGLDRLDLVLSDTQGGEVPVLESARDTLRSGRVRFLVVSTHHHLITGDPLTHQRCLALLEELGAHVIAEHTVSESCSGDGLIAVSMDPRDRDLTVEVSYVRARDSLFGELEYDLAAERRWQTRARRRVNRTLDAVSRLVRR